MPTDQPLTLGVKSETRMTAAVISNPANRNKNLGQSCSHSEERGGGAAYILCIYSKFKLNMIWYYLVSAPKYDERDHANCEDVVYEASSLLRNAVCSFLLQMLRNVI